MDAKKNNSALTCKKYISNSTEYPCSLSCFCLTAWSVKLGVLSSMLFRNDSCLDDMLCGFCSRLEILSRKGEQNHMTAIGQNRAGVWFEGLCKKIVSPSAKHTENIPLLNCHIPSNSLWFDLAISSTTSMINNTMRLCPINATTGFVNFLLKV